ncbi:hypothetical protein V500_05781 [Pseudogymnoascus sp. VKM F-4518 (FW-2643)]|nr:hypothetical protein V500_05781 [Pseudogymnoascus sp. VKM F-4518 (FW-2643)]
MALVTRQSQGLKSNSPSSAVSQYKDVSQTIDSAAGKQSSCPAKMPWQETVLGRHGREFGSIEQFYLHAAAAGAALQE